MLKFLMVESETAHDRERRRASAGKSAGESFAATLRQMEPTCDIAYTAPSESDDDVMPADAIAAFDAVFLSGSPLHVYCATPETERQLTFMRNVFASGTPSFGSCAGLQIAVAAAGGTVRRMPDRIEAGIARGITASDVGRTHPLLAGRPPAWDALGIHTDETAELPTGATLLARSRHVAVQAVEIRDGNGIFWGVQYHPELSPGEIGAALRRQAGGLVEEGIAADEAMVHDQAALFDGLERNPDDRHMRWRLGVDDQVGHADQRRRELRNFIDHLVTPTAQRRRLMSAEATA